MHDFVCIGKGDHFRIPPRSIRISVSSIRVQILLDIMRFLRRGDGKRTDSLQYFFILNAFAWYFDQFASFGVLRIIKGSIHDRTFELIKMPICKIKATVRAALDGPFFQSNSGFCQLIPREEA